jgi:N-carbamoylputrescine amidase
MLDGYAVHDKKFQQDPQKYSLLIDDVLIKQYCHLAADVHCNLLIGLTLREEDTSDIVYRDAVIFINNRGELQGKYAKVHSEYNGTEFHFYKHGGEYPVFDCPLGEETLPIGVVICYEGLLPEPTRILRIKGAHVIFNPAASSKFLTGWSTKLLKVRAYENRCFMVGVNHASRRYWGFSFVTSPSGRVIKRLMPWQSVGIVDLNLELVEKAHNPLLTRRPSTYQEILQATKL